MASPEEPVIDPVPIEGFNMTIAPVDPTCEPGTPIPYSYIVQPWSTTIEFANVAPELTRIIMGTSPAEQAQRAFEDARRAVTDGLERTTNRIAELRQQRTDINEEIRLLLNQQGRLARMVRDAQGENR
jgi:hypothetical protein